VAAVSLSVSDLTPFTEIDSVKAQAMIDDALALAARVAPCILEDTFEHDAAAKAVLRGAILRWNDAGTGALQAQAAGPFSQSLDTRQQRRGMFWPSEITQLQELCRDGDPTGQAFTIDSTPSGAYGTEGYWSAPDTWVALP
jgi:hypothetical protein